MSTDRRPGPPDDVAGHFARGARRRSGRTALLAATQGDGRVTTSTSVSAPARLLAGAGALLVVDVASAEGTPPPTGAIRAVLEGPELGLEIARGDLGPDGRGLLTVVLSLGEHAVRVCYDGDPGHAPSASAARVLKVLAHPTLVTLTGGADTVASGETVLLTATVRSDEAAPSPSGTVVFLDGPRELGTARLGADGAAVLPTSSLDTGLHRIVAAYSGDAAHAGARSTPMPQAVVVRRAPTRILIEQRRDGDDAVLAIRLVDRATGRRVRRATGEVTVEADGAGPVRLVLVEGCASVRLPGSADAGLRASYTGDAEHGASTVGLG